MKQVCVITGGSSGIGFATAKRMGKKGYTLVLAVRTPAKLDKALAELSTEGIEAVTCRCDIGSWESVQGLAAYSASLGQVEVVLHIAGMSPHMGDAEQIMTAQCAGRNPYSRRILPCFGRGGRTH